MSYYNKYLKYKSKYLEYKISIGGSNLYVPPCIRNVQPPLRNKKLVLDVGGEKKNITYEAGDIIIWRDNTGFIHLDEEFKISTCAKHVFKIEDCNIINKLNEINDKDNNFIICIHYKDKNDIQLGITETGKNCELNEKTAQRGIYEEVGYLLDINIFNNNKISCNFPSNRNAKQFDSYIININDNKLKTNEESQEFSIEPDNVNMKKAFIILYGTQENLEVILKMRKPPEEFMYDQTKKPELVNKYIEKEINIYNNLSMIAIKIEKFIELAKTNLEDVPDLYGRKY